MTHVPPCHSTSAYIIVLLLLLLLSKLKLFFPDFVAGNQECQQLELPMAGYGLVASVLGLPTLSSLQIYFSIY